MHLCSQAYRIGLFAMRLDAVAWDATSKGAPSFCVRIFVSTRPPPLRTPSLKPSEGPCEVPPDQPPEGHHGNLREEERRAPRTPPKRPHERKVPDQGRMVRGTGAVQSMMVEAVPPGMVGVGRTGTAKRSSSFT